MTGDMQGGWRSEGIPLTYLVCQIKKPLNIQGFQPADDGTRTRDLLTTNEVRYHLCHISVLCFSSSSEPHI